MALRHPGIDRLRQAFGRAYQPERALLQQAPVPQPRQPVPFRGGHAGLVTRALPAQARKSCVQDHRAKLGGVLPVSAPQIAPHPNQSRSITRGRA